jgi:hypothetical protein
LFFMEVRLRRLPVAAGLSGQSRLIPRVLGKRQGEEGVMADYFPLTTSTSPWMTTALSLAVGAANFVLAATSFKLW